VEAAAATAEEVPTAARVVGCPELAARPVAVWAVVAAVLEGYWAEVAAAAEARVPMAATVVEFPEPAVCPAVALARQAAGFSVADLPVEVEAEESGYPVVGSAVTGPARRWSMLGCSWLD
jgi:hypothetical protein